MLKKIYIIKTTYNDRTFEINLSSVGYSTYLEALTRAYELQKAEKDSDVLHLVDYIMVDVKD